MTAVFPAATFVCMACTKSRGGGAARARRSISSIETSRRAAAVSARLVARMRCRMSDKRASPFAAELVRCGDEVVELGLGFAARDHPARALDSVLQRLGLPRDVDRGARVEHDDIERRARLVLQHR